MVNIKKTLEGSSIAGTTRDAIQQNYNETFNIKKDDAVGNFVTKSMAVNQMNVGKLQGITNKRSSGTILKDLVNKAEGKPTSDEKPKESQGPRLGGFGGLVQSFIKS